MCRARHPPPPHRLQEKHELERSWAAKLHDAGRQAGEAQAALRAQVEARLAAVTQHVGVMVQREARKERKRGGHGASAGGIEG
jgi:uncharacterized protein YciW